MHFSLTDLAADITQNGSESGAALIGLEIRETVEQADTGRKKNDFRFIISDNGKGMSRAELDRAMDPFVTDGVKHPGRKVGLGIPFLIQTALQSGGGWRIVSARAGEEATIKSGGVADTAESGSCAERFSISGVSGTVVEAWFDLANVDTPPVGDIPGLFRMVLLFTGPDEIVLRRVRKGPTGKAELDYEVKKTELVEALGGDLEDVSSLVLLGEYLHSLEGE